MSNVSVSAGSLAIGSCTLPLDQVLNVETISAENTLRNLWFFLWGCLGPIAAMVIFSTLEHQPGLMWGLGVLTGAGPFIAILSALAWKRPWGVVIETPTAYCCVYQTGDRAQADALTAQIRKAIGG